MPDISSLHNPRVIAAAKLRDRRQRDKQGRILIDGARELHRALRGGVEFVEVYLCAALCRSAEAHAAAAALGSAGVEVLRVAENVFTKLAFGERNDGILGVAQTPHRPLGELTLPTCPLVGVLEGVEKPGNVGAVARSADGAGLSALIVADGGTDLFNPNAIRASLGTLFTLPMGTATSSATLDWLLAQGLTIYAARVDGAVSYTDVDYRRPAAIVLGSEAHGLSSVWQDPRVTAVCLPMRGVADSLNVSVAAAVLFYEALRQRMSLHNTPAPDGRGN